jgi:hypothetical protein
MDPSYAISVLKNGYLQRNHNQFNLLDDRINQDRYELEWQKRDLNVLKHSKRTNMVNLLRDYIVKTLTTPDYPELKDVSVVVNTYPYTLSNAQLTEYFSIFRYLFDTKHVARIHAPLSTLSMPWLTSNYDRFILHDFNEWIIHQRESIQKYGNPQFTVCVPLTRLKEGVNNGISDDDVVSTVTNTFARYIDLEFFKLEDISICKFEVPET